MNDELTIEQRLENLENLLLKSPSTIDRTLTPKQKKLRKKIKEELQDKIKKRNDPDSIDYKLSLVDDYIHMWEVQQLMYLNIDKRGIEVPYYDRSGNLCFKKNDFVSAISTLNKQMLSLLNEMNLKADDYEDNGTNESADI